MTVKQWLLCAFLAMSTSISLGAETKEDEFFPDLMILASEDRFDLVRGQKSTQEIKITRYSGPSIYHEIERRDSKTKKLITIEATAEWNTVFVSPDSEHYVDQTLTKNYGGKNNRSFFGRMEVKKISNHQIVDAWPVFGIVISSKKNITVVATAHMSNGMKYVYTEVFEKRKRSLPLSRRSQVFDNHNNIMSDLLFVRK